eukprot:2965907-Alexandrium_andersonii.AAC.1
MEGASHRRRTNGTTRMLLLSSTANTSRIVKRRMLGMSRLMKYWLLSLLPMSLRRARTLGPSRTSST